MVSTKDFIQLIYSCFLPCHISILIAWLHCSPYKPATYKSLIRSVKKAKARNIRFQSLYGGQIVYVIGLHAAQFGNIYKIG